MEPISTIIVGALVSGAASIAGEAIKDAYNGLKTLISDRYSNHQDLMSAVDAVAEKPDDEARKATLEAELTTAGATKDVVLIEAANAVHLAGGAQQVRKRSLGNRLKIKFKQVEALENQLTLALDEGQKVLLEAKTEPLWVEITKLEEDLLNLG